MTTSTLYDMRGILAGAFQWATTAPTIDGQATVEITLTGPTGIDDTGHQQAGPFNPDEAAEIAAGMNRVARKHAHATGVILVGPDEFDVVETMGGRAVKIERHATQAKAVATAKAWARSYAARYVGYLQCSG